MTKIIPEAVEKESKNAVWGRKEVAEKISSFETIAQQGVSQRQGAEELKIPRTTLQHWLKRKKISVCQDETFHPEICLVGIEPVSNFILVEKYADNRDESSWNGAMREAVEGLEVQIIQSTSDEGKGLLAHVDNGLGVHHSPD